MGFQFTIPHTFSKTSIHAHAPAASGVYGISNAAQWIYIGEADDIQGTLLGHLGEYGGQINAHLPTGFSFELCDRPTMTGRHQRLVTKYSPILNRQPGFGRQK